MSQSRPNCQRCKTEMAVQQCDSCQPFHFFCSQCDTTVHSFPSKSFHGRINLLSPKEDTMTYHYSPNQLNEKEFNSNANCNFYNQSMSKDIQKSHIDASTSEYGLIYTREYVNELKRLFEKEKEELQFKIVSMQNNIDRLKSSFQAQMQKMQDDAIVTFNKTKLKEEDYENKLRALTKTKNSTINQLINENNAIKALSNEFNSNLNKHIEHSKEASSSKNQQIESLKKEIDNLNKATTQMQQEGVNEVQSLMKSNKSALELQDEMHKKEMSDKTYEFKYHQEQLRKEIDMNGRENKELTERNEKYKVLIDELNQKNDLLQRENDGLKGNCDRMNSEVNQLNQRNEMLIRSYEKEKSGSNQMRQDLGYLEKTINSLRAEITELKEANYKQESDYNILMCQSEKMRRDFSEKLFNVSIVRLNKLSE